ncbi:MAG: hypothetical protein WC557_00170 [Ignavibacteriaceae bacterium]
MNIEPPTNRDRQGISNDEVEIQITFTSKFIIPCRSRFIGDSLFDIQLSLTCYY